MTRITVLEKDCRNIYKNSKEIIKISNSIQGQIENRNELFVFNRVIEDFKLYICPILKYEDDIKIVMPYCDKVSEKDFLRFKKTKLYKNLFNYLVKFFYVEEVELENINNWGKLNNNIVLCNYGQIFCGSELSE